MKTEIKIELGMKFKHVSENEVLQITKLSNGKKFSTMTLTYISGKRQPFRINPDFFQQEFNEGKYEIQ